MTQHSAGPEATAAGTAPAAGHGPGTRPEPGTDPGAGPLSAAGEAVRDARSVSVSVNGEARALPAGTDLGALLATLTQAASGVAAAVNESVVPRGRWAATTLGEGDRVEILIAVQGG
ncbi:sulfur carrier protein ThiS [Streptomyces sp. MMG1522]|uniref:sulfur carrier protein ThiS n=1 Tax=Streptomyces sp. MMG1522 TaxID=1415545 RepID=UPI00099B82D5